jgi:hypothetical protein
MLTLVKQNSFTHLTVLLVLTDHSMLAPSQTSFVDRVDFVCYKDPWGDTLSF